MIDAFGKKRWRFIDAGYDVSVICPIGKGYDKSYEVIDGVHIYRHPLKEAQSTNGYIREYSSALAHQLVFHFASGAGSELMPYRHAIHLI